MTKKRTSEDSRRKYITCASRLFEGIEARCALTCELPSVRMVPSQMAIRSKMLATSTMNAEISSIRFVLREVVETETWEHMFNMPDWVVNCSWKTVESLLATNDMPIQWLKENARTEIKTAYEKALSFDANLTEEEAITRISHTSVKGRERTQNKGRISVSWREYLAYEIALANEDSVETLVKLHEGKTVTRGVLRLFISAMFLTGMRPIEVWDGIMMVPDPSLSFDNDMRRLIYNDPHQAIIDGVVIPLEAAAKQMGEQIGKAAHRASDVTGAPVIFAVRSAKQTNANPHLKAPFRLLTFDNLHERELSVLSMSTQLKHVGLTARQKATYRSAMLDLLKSISKAEPNTLRSDVNLYSFRHAFVDRVRRAYDPSEAAAMSGHTSRKTLYAYGEHRTRKGKRGGPGLETQANWIPKPDLTLARMIENLWKNGGDLDIVGVVSMPDLPDMGQISDADDDPDAGGEDSFE